MMRAWLRKEGARLAFPLFDSARTRQAPSAGHSPLNPRPRCLVWLVASDGTLPPSSEGDDTSPFLLFSELSGPGLLSWCRVFKRVNVYLRCSTRLRCRCALWTPTPVQGCYPSSAIVAARESTRCKCLPPLELFAVDLVRNHIVAHKRGTIKCSRSR